MKNLFGLILLLAFYSCSENLTHSDNESEIIRLNELTDYTLETFDFENVDLKLAEELTIDLYNAQSDGLITRGELKTVGSLGQLEMIAAILVVYNFTKEEYLSGKVNDEEEEIDLEHPELESRGTKNYKYNNGLTKRYWWFGWKTKYKCDVIVNFVGNCNGAPIGTRWRKCHQIKCNNPC